MNAASLVGTWALESWELTDSKGVVDHPFGKKPVGYLMYSPEGYMSVALMAAGREPFAATDIFGGSPAEKSAAIETYISYSGRYEIQGDVVRHNVEVSLFPNWIKSTLERTIDLQGDTLRLTTQPDVFKGTTQTASLVWKRVR
jgi:hypothetical protein